MPLEWISAKGRATGMFGYGTKLSRSGSQLFQSRYKILIAPQDYYAKYGRDFGSTGDVRKMGEHFGSCASLPVLFGNDSCNLPFQFRGVPLDNFLNFL